jgi:NADH-quinone oxidoreductase subunit G
VLTGGRLTAEDAYAYSKFARAVLGTNDIDFRARRTRPRRRRSSPPRWSGPRSTSRTRTSRRHGAVVLAGFEPEDESPIVFLRLRKAFRRNGPRVFSVASHTTRASTS